LPAHLGEGREWEVKTEANNQCFAFSREHMNPWVSMLVAIAGVLSSKLWKIRGHLQALKGAVGREGGGI
jgi:hypothetical protein